MPLEVRKVERDNKNKPMVYISHPSGGLKENTLEIEQAVKILYESDEIYNRFCIVSPVHCYGFMYKEYESNYYKGLSFCTDLLRHCDIMIVLGDWENSTGCKEEVKLCNELNIPYIEIRTFDELISNVKGSLADDMNNLIQ